MTRVTRVEHASMATASLVARQKTMALASNSREWKVGTRPELAWEMLLVRMQRQEDHGRGVDVPLDTVPEINCFGHGRNQGAPVASAGWIKLL